MDIIFTKIRAFQTWVISRVRRTGNQVKTKIYISTNSPSVLNFDVLPLDLQCSIITDNLKEHKDQESVEIIQIQHRINLLYLPVDIGYFSNVRTIILCDNALAELPWSLIYLKQLAVLDVSYNLLKTFPFVVVHLRNIRTLNISNNPNISGIPDSILQLEKLETIDFSGLPKLHPDMKALVGKSVSEIFKKLSSRSLRNNLWSDRGTVNSLINLCMETIIQTRVDYFNLDVLPSRMKGYINDEEEMYSKQTNVGKCSRCKKYFSTRAFFYQHIC